MVPTRLRPSRFQLLGGVLAVCGVLVYEYSLFWVNYGPVSNHVVWLLGLLVVPALLVLTAGQSQWDSRTVVALLVLGAVASVVGFVGSSASTLGGPILGPEAYHAFQYDWASNTLRYGMTDPGGVPTNQVHPNRLSTLLGTVALALGVYGWLPRRWASVDATADPTVGSSES